MVKFYKIQTSIWYKNHHCQSSTVEVPKLKTNSNFFGSDYLYIDQPPSWKENDSSNEDFLIKLFIN